jgi:hypothetical protein
MNRSRKNNNMEIVGDSYQKPVYKRRPSSEQLRNYEPSTIKSDCNAKIRVTTTTANTNSMQQNKIQPTLSRKMSKNNLESPVKVPINKDYVSYLETNSLTNLMNLCPTINRKNIKTIANYKTITETELDCELGIVIKTNSNENSFKGRSVHVGLLTGYNERCKPIRKIGNSTYYDICEEIYNRIGIIISILEKYNYEVTENLYSALTDISESIENILSENVQ